MVAVVFVGSATRGPVNTIAGDISSSSYVVIPPELVVWSTGSNGVTSSVPTSGPLVNETASFSAATTHIVGGMSIDAIDSAYSC